MGLFGKKDQCTCNCGCQNEVRRLSMDEKIAIAEIRLQMDKPPLDFSIIICDRCMEEDHKNSQKKPRRGWTDSQIKQIMARQNGVCAYCGEHAGSFHLHHKDGDHSNNDIDNAEGWCPNCHDRESRNLN